MPKSDRIRVGSPLTPSKLNEIGELDEFPISQKSYVPDGDWTLIYRIWGCHGYKKHPNSQNRDMGILRIRRKTDNASDSFTLEIDQDTINDTGILNQVHARIYCAKDHLASPKEWQITSRFIDSEKNLMPKLSTEERGEIKNNTMIIKTKGREFKRELSTPLTSDWSLFEALQRIKFNDGSSVQFNLLEGLCLFKPNQKLTYRGKEAVKINENVLMLHRFDQLGEGILPYEYWLDDQHRLLAAISMNKVYIVDDQADEVMDEQIEKQRQRYLRRKKK